MVYIIGETVWVLLLCPNRPTIIMGYPGFIDEDPEDPGFFMSIYNSPDIDKYVVTDEQYDKLLTRPAEIFSHTLHDPRGGQFIIRLRRFLHNKRVYELTLKVKSQRDITVFLGDYGYVIPVKKEVTIKQRNLIVQQHKNMTSMRDVDNYLKQQKEELHHGSMSLRRSIPREVSRNIMEYLGGMHRRGTRRLKNLR